MHLGRCSRDGLTNQGRLGRSRDCAASKAASPPLATGLARPLPRRLFGAGRRAASGTCPRKAETKQARRAKQAASCCPQGKGEPAFGRRRGPRTAAGGCACFFPTRNCAGFCPGPSRSSAFACLPFFYGLRAPLPREKQLLNLLKYGKDCPGTLRLRAVRCGINFRGLDRASCDALIQVGKGIQEGLE